MPATTITINREQRDGLYELTRNHLGSPATSLTRWSARRTTAKPSGSALS